MLANVRGGGEMGPKWHSQALRENHQLVFDDTICVVEALHKDGISCPSKTSLMGGSNGGLTVLACMNQRPDLFGAILSQCPLANMKTYHKITCGASWVAEYGNADENDDWSFIGKYSPGFFFFYSFLSFIFSPFFKCKTLLLWPMERILRCCCLRAPRMIACIHTTRA